MSAEPNTYDVIMSLVAHLGTLRGWRIVSMQAMIAPGGEPHVRAEGANASLRLSFTRHGSPVLAIEVNVTTHRGPVTTAVLSRIESPVMLVASPRPSEWADILRQMVIELSAAARRNSDIIAEPAAWGLIVGGLDDEDVGDPDSGPLTGDGTLPPLVTHVTKATARALARDLAPAVSLGERLAAVHRISSNPTPFCSFIPSDQQKINAQFDALIGHVAAHRAAQTPPDEPAQVAPCDALDALAARCVDAELPHIGSELYALSKIWRDERKTMADAFPVWRDGEPPLGDVLREAEEGPRVVRVINHHSLGGRYFFWPGNEMEEPWDGARWALIIKPLAEAAPSQDP